MKALAVLLLTVWLLCGMAAGFIIADTRPLHLSDIALGPISLATILRT